MNPTARTVAITAADTAAGTAAGTAGPRGRVRSIHSGAAPRPLRFCALGMTAAAAASFAVLGTGAGTAEASPKRAQITYACQAAPEGFEDQSSAYDFVASLELDLPDQVAPGDSIPLDGTFSVQMPEELRKLTADYFGSMQVVADDLTVPVTVGGTQTPVPVSRFDSGPMSPKEQPMIVSGPVGAEPFAVPQDASGEVAVGLPANGSAQSIIDGSPVAFNASAFVSGGIVESFFDKYTYKLACSLPEGADATVARIPVAGGAPGAGGAPAPAGGNTAAGGAAAAAAGGANGGAGGGGGGASGNSGGNSGGNAPAKAAPSSSAPKASPKLAEAVGGGAGSGAGAAGAGADSAQDADVAPMAATTSGRSGDVFVPGWLVAVVALLLISGAVGLAVHAQLRVNRLRDELEG